MFTNFLCISANLVDDDDYSDSQAEPTALYYTSLHLDWAEKLQETPRKEPHLLDSDLTSLIRHRLGELFQEELKSWGMEND